MEDIVVVLMLYISYYNLFSSCYLTYSKVTVTEVNYCIFHLHSF